MCLRHGPTLDRRRVLGLLSGAAAMPFLGGCDEIPVQLVSDETVRQLGLESWERLRARTAVSRVPEYHAVLQRVGERLLATAGAPRKDWEMVVFAGDEVNAFALPGGKIGVYEGMFQLAANTDQLAAVIGHEIGHNAAEHSQERLSAAAAKQWGLRLISTALQMGDVAYANEIAALLGLGVEFGLVLPYSRGQELEADALGLKMMAQAGFDPREAAALWRRMDALQADRAPAFLSTHPAPTARIEAIEAMLPELAQAGRQP